MMLENDSLIKTDKSDIVELFDETIDPDKEFSRSLESRISQVILMRINLII